MKHHLTTVVPLSLLLAAFTLVAPAPAHAQDQSAASSLQPPTILVLNTEVLKSGGNPFDHQKTEAAFVQTLRSANSPAHYIGLDSLTGRERAVFIHSYDSFADWQHTVGAEMQNASMSDEMSSNVSADDALLSSYTTSVYHFRKDLSLNPGAPVGTRFFELTVFHVRSGHAKDWDNMVKMFRDAEAKIPGDHWDIFEKLYGEHSGGTYLLAVPMTSLADIDTNMMNRDKLKDIVGADQLQKMMALGDATIESEESNLFVINPKMSYQNAVWTKADPKFWGQ